MKTPEQILKIREEYFLNYIIENNPFFCPLSKSKEKCNNRYNHLCCLDSSEVEYRKKCWRKAADIMKKMIYFLRAEGRILLPFFQYIGEKIDMGAKRLYRQGKKEAKMGFLKNELSTLKSTHQSMLDALWRCNGPSPELVEANIPRLRGVVHWLMSIAMSRLELDTHEQGHKIYRPLNQRLRNKHGRNVEDFFAEFGKIEQDRLVAAFDEPHIKQLMNLYPPRFFGVHVAAVCRRYLSIPYPDIDVCVPGWSGYYGMHPEVGKKFLADARDAFPFPNCLRHCSRAIDFTFAEEAEKWQRGASVVFPGDIWHKLSDQTAAWYAACSFFA